VIGLVAIALHWVSPVNAEETSNICHAYLVGNELATKVTATANCESTPMPKRPFSPAEDQVVFGMACSMWPRRKANAGISKSPPAWKLVCSHVSIKSFPRRAAAAAATGNLEEAPPRACGDVGKGDRRSDVASAELSQRFGGWGCTAQGLAPVTV
jgi:hypothetical protein